MIVKIKKILKKLKFFILIFVRKGFFYHFFQSLFINIQIRKFAANIEKIIVNFFNREISLELKKNTYIYPKEQTLNLKKQGVTKPFVVDSFLKNKNEIINYFYNNKIFYEKYNKGFNYSLNEKPHDLDIGYYSDVTTSQCPFLVDIINDELILATLANYFQAPFKLDYVTCWWSFNHKFKKIEKTQKFHRDIDNFNFAKVFLYMTDIDFNTGPHQYVKYSHLNRFEKKLSKKTLNENEIDTQNIFTFTGKAGDAIIANTFGVHRGMEPILNDRLIMVMSYSLVNTSYSPQVPLINLNNIKYNKSLNKLNKYVLSSYLK